METILFTDIEGSTRLWEEHRDAMSAALARHDAILSRAVEGAGGRVLKTTGDGCIAIFGAPPDAVSAARGIQAALAGETWGETGPVRARIGIHYGETENRDNDYFGPAMNRAARIMAAGHGGQVLLSESVAHLVEGALPEGAALRDLGAHRLKDLTQPEHLYQLIAPELPSEFPALRTLDARPGNLPLQTTEFLGRSAELAAIEAIVRSPGARLVTITGPGGSGKTRIALQAGAEMLDDFRDGAFFVDLSAERTPDGAFEAVVRALDLPVSGNGGPLETLKVRLRDKQMLLVLDNFEQVIDAASGVSELLQALPEIELIVTSRESLRIRGEHVFPVPPLSLPGANAPFDAVMASEAVRLFEARGRAVRPDFMVTPENARTVAAICERLDALPLAIELAAARLRLFSPGDLLARLQDRLDVVGAGGRDLPDRQRTLWGAIGWSYDLLDEDECDLLQLMSVFSSADLDGLEAVAGGAGVAAPVLDTLESLVDKSLVESHPDRTQRFSMLRMVKVFAGERLADSPEKEQQAREAHARYFTEVARRLKESLRGSGQDAALGELEAELGNLRTAWEYWLSMGDIEQLFALEDPLWSLHAAKGWYHASIDLTQSMLSALAESGRASEFAARELALRTNLARALMAVGGYNAEVEVALGRALELAEAGGMTEEEFPMLRALASIYNQRTSWDAAIAIGRQLIALGERKQDRLMLAEGHYVIGVNTLFTHPMSALGELEEAIELFGPEAPAGERLRLGPNSAVMARTAMALMLWMGGSLDRAIEVSDEALLMARRMNHPYTLAYALYHSGFLAINRGRFEECVRFADELRDVSAEHGYPIWGTLATLLDGVATAALGDASEGLARAEAAVELYQGLTPPPAFWPFVLMLRAAVHAMAGMPNRSVELLEEANAALASVDAEAPPLTVMRADMMRLLPEPDVEAIEELYLSAIASGRASGHRLAALTGATGLVTLRRELGKTPDGIEELAAVYRTFDEGRDERDVVAARRLLGLLAD